MDARSLEYCTKQTKKNVNNVGIYQHLHNDFVTLDGVVVTSS